MVSWYWIQNLKDKRIFNELHSLPPLKVKDKIFFKKPNNKFYFITNSLSNI